MLTGVMAAAIHAARAGPKAAASVRQGRLASSITGGGFPARQTASQYAVPAVTSASLSSGSCASTKTWSG